MNALDGLGQTALHRVGQQGNMQACRLLMSYAIDPSIVSLQGYTAAQLATENIQKLLRGLCLYASYHFYCANVKVDHARQGLQSLEIECTVLLEKICSL